MSPECDACQRAAHAGLGVGLWWSVLHMKSTDGVRANPKWHWSQACLGHIGAHEWSQQPQGCTMKCLACLTSAWMLGSSGTLLGSNAWGSAAAPQVLSSLESSIITDCLAAACSVRARPSLLTLAVAWPSCGVWQPRCCMAAATEHLATVMPQSKWQPQPQPARTAVRTGGPGGQTH